MQWEVYRLPLDEKYMSALRFSRGPATSAPAFFRGEFVLDKQGDTFLDMSQWKKGVVWVNGHNLGRYWNIGPQQRLYCPAPWLRQGKNEVIILDPEMTTATSLRGFAEMR
jgi:beta-galactosidase